MSDNRRKLVTISSLTDIINLIGGAKDDVEAIQGDVSDRQSDIINRQNDVSNNQSKVADDAEYVSGRVASLEGTVSVISESDDYVELYAINPADLVETTEVLGDFTINIVEIIQ